MKQMAFRTYSIVLVFITAISFPLINSRVHLLKDIESFENRKMTNQPEFNIHFLDPFPGAFESFYNDHFELRNRLIRCFNIYNIKTFRKSPVPSVVIGEDGWLFIGGTEMDSYLGKNKLTANQLNSIKLELEYRKKYLEERNIKFYFLIAPCKASIHSEKLGYEYFTLNKKTWGEELNDYLAQHSSVHTVDVFAALRKHKKNNNLFLKLDHHWNDLGAFYAANEVFKCMQTDFPSVDTLSLEDFDLHSSENPNGNLEKILGNLNLFSEISLTLSPKKGFKASDAPATGYPSTPGFVYTWEYEKVRAIKNSSKPKLLIISDSFGGEIFPFVAENFSKTVKIFDSWQFKLNEHIVSEENPDAVLLVINELVIKNLLEFQSRPKH